MSELLKWLLTALLLGSLIWTGFEAFAYWMPILAAPITDNY